MVGEQSSYEPPAVEARAYGPNSTPAEVEALRGQIWVFAPGIIMYKEIPVLSLFHLDVYEQRLVELAATMESFKLLIDLRVAGRPNAAVRDRLKKMFARPGDMSQVAVFTGRNLLLNMAAKFVLSSAGLPRVSVVKTLDDALEVLGAGGSASVG